MSRTLYTDPPQTRTASEYDRWPAKLRTLWKKATAPQQRRALAARWHFRKAARPDALPLPECPLARALCLVELTYRNASHCRGGKQEWER